METGKNSLDTFCVGQTKKEELHSAFTLLIESEFDHLSYSIIDKKANQCVGLCSFSIPSSFERMERRENIHEILSTDEILNFSFASRLILMANRECVFIPEEIFDETLCESYLNSSFGEMYTGRCYFFEIT